MVSPDLREDRSLETKTPMPSGSSGGPHGSISLARAGELRGKLGGAKPLLDGLDFGKGWNVCLECVVGIPCFLFFFQPPNVVSSLSHRT